MNANLHYIKSLEIDIVKQDLPTSKSTSKSIVIRHLRLDKLIPYRPRDGGR